MDNHFIGGHQVESFKIKPLMRAVIIIIEKGIPDEAYNVEEQEVRLVRTGVTIGLSQPITFDGWRAWIRSARTKSSRLYRKLFSLLWTWIGGRKLQLRKEI